MTNNDIEVSSKHLSD